MSEQIPLVETPPRKPRREDWHGGGRTLDEVCRQQDPVGYRIYDQWSESLAVAALSQHDLSCCAQAMYEIDNLQPENEVAVYAALSEYGKILARSRSRAR